MAAAAAGTPVFLEVRTQLRSALLILGVLCRNTETFIERLTKVAGFLLELIHILRYSEKSANV